MMYMIEEIAGENHGAMMMKVDDMSAINLIKNLIAHGRSKHIEMRFNYLREHVSNGKLNLEQCRTENQIAEIMTKAVHVELFKRLETRGGKMDRGPLGRPLHPPKNGGLGWDFMLAYPLSSRRFKPVKKRT